MTFIEMIEAILEKSSGAMHVDDIALELAATYPYLQEDVEELKAKANQFLANAVKKKDSKFSKPKNKQGRPRRGMYRIKRKASAAVHKPIVETPKVTTHYTGAAGEHAVMSELLFWGFNASIMVVDDGIDVVASKNGDYFHIQVKTANEGSNGSFQSSIKRDRFLAKHKSNTFCILVLRRLNNGTNLNDYIILPSNYVKRLDSADVISGIGVMSLRVSIENSGKYLLNKVEDVTSYVNDWPSIV